MTADSEAVQPGKAGETGVAAGCPRARRRRRLGLWTLATILLTGLAGVVAIVLLIGQTMSAPDWLRERISDRIERQAGGMQVVFGDVNFVVRHGWRPRLRLQDVQLSDAGGLPIVHLSDAEATLSMRALVRGQLQPKRIALTGASAALRRDKTGAVTLEFGTGGAAVRQAASLRQLIETWKAALAGEALSRLSEVELAALTFRYEDGRSGRGWTVDDASVTFTREDGELRISSSFALLGGGDEAAAVAMNYAGHLDGPEAEFGVTVKDIPAGDIAVQSAALGWLDVLRAPISGALRGSVDAEGALGTLSASLQIGAGVLQPTDQTRPIHFSGARSYFTYDPDEELLSFDEMAVDSQWVSGSADGTAILSGITDGQLTDLVGQFNLNDLTLNPEGLYDEPLVLDEGLAEFRMQLDPFEFRLGQGRATVGDTALSLNGRLAAAPTGWDLAFDARSSEIEVGRLKELWPEAAIVPARRWVGKNLLQGNLSDVDIAVRSTPDRVPEVYIDFDFDDAAIRFLKDMPLLEEAAGRFTLSGNRLVATAFSGKVQAETGGKLDASGTSFIMPDTSIKPKTPAIVQLEAEGEVTSILSVLDQPPVRALRNTTLPVDLANGRARLSGVLSLPLGKKVPYEVLRFDVDGAISDVSSDVLVPGHVVSASELRVHADQNGVTLEGRAAVSGVPADIRWHQPIGPDAEGSSRVTGDLMLSQQVIDAFEIGLPDGTVSGEAPGQFTLDMVAGRPPRLTLRSSLAGVGLSIPQLGWRKPVDEDAVFEVSGEFGEQVTIDKLILETAGLATTGTVIVKPGGGLDRALLSSVRLAGWLNAAVEFVGRGEGLAPDLRILGGRVDLRNATFDTGPVPGGSVSARGNAATGGLTVSLDRLQVTDTIALTGFAGQFVTGRGLEGRFQGKVNGGTTLLGGIRPEGGESVMSFVSEDAGGIFRDAGILRQARGGDFRMELRPAEGKPGEFDGRVRVENTKVLDAPAIAALLNAVSVIGLLDEMAGQGIQFSEVDAEFRLSPSQVTLLRSSAVGPSLGFSMDGYYDPKTENLNMQGVVSPVYMLNGIASFLTRKGEGLVGFSYNLKGSAQSPKVSVNPLSVLTPGMFREIFRRPPPQVNGQQAPQAEIPRSGGPDGADGEETASTDDGGEAQGGGRRGAGEVGDQPADADTIEGR